jgi:hypothetical protein
MKNLESFKDILFNFLDQPSQDNLDKLNDMALLYTNEWIKSKASGSNEIQDKIKNLLNEGTKKLDVLNNPLKKADNFNRISLIIERSDRFLNPRRYKKSNGEEIQPRRLNSVQKMNTIMHRFPKIVNREIQKDGNEIIQIVSKTIDLPKHLFDYHDIALVPNLVKENSKNTSEDQDWIKFTTHNFNSLIDSEIPVKDKARFKDSVISKHQNRRWYFKDRIPWFVKKKIMIKLLKNIAREEGNPERMSNNFNIYDHANDDTRIKNVINVIRSDSLTVKAQNKYWNEISHDIENDYLRDLRKQSYLKFIIVESAYFKTNRQMSGSAGKSKPMWRDVVIYNDGAMTIRSLTDDSNHIPAVGSTDELRDLGIMKSSLNPSYWVMSNDMPQISNQSLREIVEIFIEEEKQKVIEMQSDGLGVDEIASKLDIDIIDVENYFKNAGLMNDGEGLL